MGWHQLMSKYEENVRHAFKFKDKFIRGADKRIRQITEKFYKKLKNKKKVKNIIYVGVHIRLRDSIGDIMKNYDLPMITTSSYLQAMGSLVDKLENKNTKLIFLIITDDPLPVQMEMMPRFKRAFNAYQVGTGHVNNRISVGLDMAMMSRSNYTILSYGTFSYWCGFLSGGPKLLPVHYTSQRIKWNGTIPKLFQNSFYLTDIGLKTNVEMAKSKVISPKVTKN